MSDKQKRWSLRYRVLLIDAEGNEQVMARRYWRQWEAQSEALSLLRFEQAARQGYHVGWEGRGKRVVVPSSYDDSPWVATINAEVERLKAELVATSPEPAAGRPSGTQGDA